MILSENHGFSSKNTNILEFNAFGKRKNFWIRNGFVTFHELFETKIFEKFCNFFGVASYSWKIKIFWKVLKNVKNAFPHVERGPKTDKFSNKKMGIGSQGLPAQHASSTNGLKNT